jgi:uncharacterized membrane protein HdeD (DUF308 family)
MGTAPFRRAAPTAAAGMSAAAADPLLLEALRRGRRRLMMAGGLSLLLGAAAIVVPAVASVATAVFVGWILVVAAGVQAADAIAVRHGARMALRLVLSVLTFAAGLYLLVAPLHGAFTLTVMLVIWFVASGTARIAFGIAERGMPGAGMTILSGVLSLALAVLIAEKLPSSASWAIGLIVGVDLVFAGVTLLGLARQLDVPRP